MNVQEFMPILNGISNKIDGVSAIVWQAAVKNAQLSSYTDMIWGCSFVLLCIICALLGIYAIKHETEYDYNLGLGTVSSFLALMFFFIGIANFTDAIRERINPEYYAMKEIAHMVKE